MTSGSATAIPRARWVAGVAAGTLILVGIGHSPAARAGPAPTAFTIDVNAGRSAISPLIYGVNPGPQPLPVELAAVRPPLVRLGGNRWTAYNWENNFSNAGNDFHYQNDNYLSSSLTPGDAVKPTVDLAAAAGATTLVTVPVQDYLAGDGSGPVDLADANRFNARFVHNHSTSPGPLTDTPDLADGSAYQDQFVHWLKDAAPSASLLFSLDNEVDLWHETHPEVHPVPSRYAEIVARDAEYAAMIKRRAPGATVLGPVLSSWYGLQTLGGSPDYPGQGWFVDYYLAHLKTAEQAAGIRLVDDFDQHWYPANADVGHDKIDPATVAEREQNPRSLWDPTYVETSYIPGTLPADDQAIKLIPRLKQKIAALDPGISLAFTEWNYGAAGDISGAIASADTLGIFGRDGVHAAAYWPLVADAQAGAGHNFSLGAFAAYRNYDGHGAAFGNTTVRALTSDPVQTSVYASIDSANPARTVIVAINKNTTATATTIDLVGQSSTAAALYTLTSAAAAPQQSAGLQAAAPGRFTYLMPAQSVSVIVPGPTTPGAGPGTLPSSTSGPGAPASIGRIGVAHVGRASTRTGATDAIAPTNCTGATGATCTITFTMTVTETLTHGRTTAVSAAAAKRKPTKRTLVVGTTSVALTAGQSQNVHLALNRTGRRLLATRRKLSVTLTATQSTGRDPTPAATKQVITFKAPRRHG